MFQRALFEGRDIEPLVEARCRVLDSVGILCQNRELLSALVSFGAVWMRRRSAFTSRPGW